MSDVGLDSRPKRRWVRPAGCLAGLAVLVGAGTWFVGAVRDAREAARSTQCRGNLYFLRLALLNYHDTYGSFPPAYVADTDGNPMHSWRVLILPFADQQRVYDQYRFNEPWNSPYNQSLANQINLHLFQCPSGPSRKGSQLTDYVVVTGPGTLFPGSETTRVSDMRDGEENAILLAEIASSNIHWMEPRDLHVAEMSFRLNDPPRPSISSPHPRGPVVAFLSGSFHADASLRPETLKSLTTIAGGEQIAVDSLIRIDPDRGGRFLAE